MATDIPLPNRLHRKVLTVIFDPKMKELERVILQVSKGHYGY